VFTRLDFAKLSLMDALDLASLIEVEALQRYMLFATQLGERGGVDAGSFFRKMADNEKKHGEQLARRRRLLFGDAPQKVTLDDVFDVEAPDVGAVHRNMSALKAMQVALSSEQKAFDFYDQALPTVNHPEIKALFQDLKEEERDHVRMIEEMIAKLPPEGKVDLEDEDAE
jgi:rubrerythrin